MRLVLKIGFVVLGGVLSFADCVKQDAKPETLCDPGENIFCRCPGGEAGTKACQADGQGFEACLSRSGECASIDPGATSSSSSSSSSSGGGEGGFGGAGGEGGGAPVGDAALFAPCVRNEECASSFCPMGYCSKLCTAFQDCEAPAGDCIRVQDVGLCLRTCRASIECGAPYGQRSLCGYSEAIDEIGQTICAFWDPEPRLPPHGSACLSDEECHLGNAHRQAVCASRACVEGCYTNRDCPVGRRCSSSRALGTCR